MSDIDQSPEAEGAEQAATEADAVLGDTAADPTGTVDADTAEADTADAVAAGAELDQDAATDAVETELDEHVEGETVPEGDETVAEDELAESALETSGEAPEG
ncbi:transcription termination/antitermination protein NusG, partial [Dietzia maris]